MARVVERFPDKAPDALAPFLYERVGWMNVRTGELLFRLGRPGSRTDEFVAALKEGRPDTSMEQRVALIRALSWPGNFAAIPVLQKAIDEKWYAANEARLCMARIQDADGTAPCCGFLAFFTGPMMIIARWFTAANG